MKLLVLGVGNILLMDDGLGVHAVTELMKEKFPENVTLMDAGTFTQDAFYLFEGYTHILVLDILHAKSEVGEIFRLTEDQLIKNTAQRMSIHDTDLIDSIDMAEKLFKFRPKVFILGMQPECFTEWSMEMSPKVKEKMPAFVQKAREEIERILAMPE